MKKTHRFSVSLLACIILIVVSLACGSTTSTSETPRISTATSESGVTLSPATKPTTESLPTESYLGDAVQDYGYALTALTVVDPATPGMFYQSEAGKKLVAVEIIVCNVSGELLGVNPLSATLLDSGGFVYQPELGGTDDQIATLDLNPGEQVRGWISFKIPENSTASSLKYLPEMFGNYYLKASLLPPPVGHIPIVLDLAPTIPSSNLGDVFEQFGYSLVATSVEDPARPGYFYTPRQGFKLVAVEITLGNVSGTEAFSVNPLYAYLVDSDGFVYDAELGGRDNQIAVLDLNVGEKVNGWVSFTITETTTPLYIKYEIGGFSSNYLIAGLK
jgi:hypothetical protein